MTGTRKIGIYRPFVLVSTIFIIISQHLFFFPVTSWASHSFVEILPAGWKEAEPRDINNTGTVTGSGVDSNGRWRGFIYSGETYMNIIPLGWERAFVNAINNMGEVVGYGLDGKYKGFCYAAGEYTEILPPGWREAYATGINDDGIIVGYGREGRTIKGFIYDNGTYLEILPVNWREAYAYDINNKGHVAGYGRDSDNNLRGYVFRNGTYTEILPPGWLEAKAVNINDNGDVSGHGRDTVYKGFIYKNGVYTEISPHGLIFLEINDMNSSGTVAGSVLYKNGEMEGFVHDGFVYSVLKPPGWKWSQAHAINDIGVMTGSGVYGSVEEGFIATGVPVINVDTRAIFFGGNLRTGLPDMTVTVKNEGSADLNIGKVTSPQPPFTISNDKCSGRNLRISAACEITYSVDKNISGRTVSSVSKIPSDDPHESMVTITLGVFPDNDGDGYTLDSDCNDNDPSVNGKDDDCDSSTEDN